MKRSTQLITLSMAVAACCATGTGEPPNFVLFMADDVSWNDIGCYGNPVVQTPNIDGLAVNGLRFDNAFLTASSCSPSRSSIIAGKYPHSVQNAAELHSYMTENEIPFPLLLKESGYYTAHAGKWHIGTAPHRAFDAFTDWDTDKSVRLLNGEGGEDYWLTRVRERPRDKPFFLFLAAHDAHREWHADEFHIQHDPEEVVIPPYFADTPETRQDLASYYNEIARFDYFIGEVVKELDSQGVLDNTFIVVMADNGRPFPRSKTRVYDSGMKTPFVVAWANGIDQKGAHCKGLVSAVDLAPTILELAGIEAPQSYQGVSFAPILKNPSAEVRNVVFSEHNWHDFEAHERMARTRNYLYVLNSRPALSNPGPVDSKRSPTQHALNQLRDAGLLNAAQADVFVAPRPIEELYDVQSDPEQLANVVSLPQYAGALEEMRQLLTNWRVNTGDTTPAFLTPDWYDRETGDRLEIEQRRGEMPGVIHR